MNKIKDAIENLRYIQKTEIPYGRLWNKCELAISALERQLKLQELGFTDDIINNYKQFEDECVSKGFTFKSLIKALEKQLNNGWIPCSRELPKEYLCKDGEYDPSDYVLVQLDNEYMKTSRYWNHRHCKDTIIKQPWLDLETWETVIAWQPLPESYES